MKNIFKLIHKDKQYKQIAGDLASGKDCHVQGLWGSSAAFLITSLANDKKLSVVAIGDPYFSYFVTGE